MIAQPPTPGMFVPLLLLCLSAVPNVLLAQGEWIHRIDDDHNGWIEPDEISDRSRRYLEEFAVPYGLSLSRPQKVERLEQAAKLHAARESGDAPKLRRTQAESGGIQGFDIDDDQTMVPGFGMGEIKYAYTKDDQDSARNVFRRYDRNDDEFLDQDEIDRVTWRVRSPIKNDENQDGKLSLMELTHYYAWRRTLTGRSTLSLGKLDESSEGEPREDRSYDRRRAGSSRDGDRGTLSLARSLIARYDFNRNDQLDPEEMNRVGIPISKVDFDRSGGVDDDEFARYLFNEMEKVAVDNQEAIPTWFFERDRNEDRQVMMSEFADTWDDAKYAMFASYDQNEDGILTMDEVIASAAVAGGSFSNRRAKVLLPRMSIVSEIEVEEDFLIGDLDVQLSITHTYVEQLDAYLVGPDGTRVELFTGVGGSDDHFENTIFDDEASERITRARAPFEGRFRPEARDQRSQKSLSHFRGQNLKGTWQLIIRASRSERSGILHGWSLLVRPEQEAVDNPDLITQRLNPGAAPSEDSDGQPTTDEEVRE